jgi:hypothetical protein
LAVRRPEERRDTIITASSADGRDRFWFAGDSLDNRHPILALVDDVRREFMRLHATLEGGYVGARIDAAEDVHLVVDSWGLGWTFLRRLDDGLVFGSDFGAVCRSGEKPPTLNRDSLLLELAIGYCPDDTTLFDEITVVPPGAMLRLGGDKALIVDQHRFQYGTHPQACHGRQSSSALTNCSRPWRIGWPVLPAGTLQSRCPPATIHVSH